MWKHHKKQKKAHNKGGDEERDRFAFRRGLGEPRMHQRGLLEGGTSTNEDPEGGKKKAISKQGKRIGDVGENIWLSETLGSHKQTDEIWVKMLNRSSRGHAVTVKRLLKLKKESAHQVEKLRNDPGQKKRIVSGYSTVPGWGGQYDNRASFVY